MPSLAELWAENNKLRLLPETLGSFTCLRLLVVHSNKVRDGVVFGIHFLEHSLTLLKACCD